MKIKDECLQGYLNLSSFKEKAKRDDEIFLILGNPKLLNVCLLCDRHPAHF